MQLKTFFLSASLSLAGFFAAAQCSICSKTASQMGEEASRGLNSGVLYLAATPLLVMGYLGYRWWRNNN